MRALQRAAFVGLGFGMVCVVGFAVLGPHSVDSISELLRSSRRTR